MLKSCFKDFDFSHNALVGPIGKWPDGNFAPSTLSDVKFLAAKQAMARYQLQSYESLCPGRHRRQGSWGRR